METFDSQLPLPNFEQKSVTDSTKGYLKSRRAVRADEIKTCKVSVRALWLNAQKEVQP
jgi:hypothetical protein